MKLMRCKLCDREVSRKELTKEHYPAKSVGNNDIVKINIAKVLQDLVNKKEIIEEKIKSKENFENFLNTYLYSDMVESVFPEGRTALSLCQKCNSFLGRYDEAYLKFYNSKGDPKNIKGFAKKTKIEIIKAVYGKFLSIPETSGELFDFKPFILDQNSEKYDGIWRIYFIKRNHSTDFPFPDIQTEKLNYDEGTVYIFSDNRFIFHLLNFEKPPEIKMTNITDILKKDYKPVEGVGPMGDYYGQSLIKKLLSVNSKDLLLCSTKKKEPGNPKVKKDI